MTLRAARGAPFLCVYTTGKQQGFKGELRRRPHCLSQPLPSRAPSTQYLGVMLDAVFGIWDTFVAAHDRARAAHHRRQHKHPRLLRAEYP